MTSSSGNTARIPMPATAYESLPWRVQNPDGISRRALRRQTGNYDAAIPPRIAEIPVAVPGEIAAEAEEAAVALANFDKDAALRLGADDPALGPMASILLRTESASSSQIEQLTTSARQLAIAELDANDKPNASMIVGNVRAMEAALALSDDITVGSILQMHDALMRNSTRLAHEAGRLRREAVWIQGDTAGPIGAAYVAPHHDRVPEALDDLVEFARRIDMPALVQVAIAHAQFETIHPFVDGNGRTGRALAQAMIRNLGLATHTTVPLSAGLLVDTDTYFAALTEYRRGDAGPIVLRFAEAARFAARTGARLVDDLASELERSRAAMQGIRRQSVAWRILPALIGQPVVNLRHLRERMGSVDAATLRALTQMTERGVLTERTSARRNRVWEHSGILEILDDYAEGVRRARP